MAEDCVVVESRAVGQCKAAVKADGLPEAAAKAEQRAANPRKDADKCAKEAK